MIDGADLTVTHIQAVCGHSGVNKEISARHHKTLWKTHNSIFEDRKLNLRTFKREWGLQLSDFFMQI